MTDPIYTFAPASLPHLSYIAMASSSDIVILTLGVVLAAVYLFREQIFAASKSKSAPIANSTIKMSNGSGNPRDFIAKMKDGVSRCHPFDGLTSLTSLLEKAHCHFLWFTNRYCRRVCDSHCKGGQTKIWSCFPCL